MNSLVEHNVRMPRCLIFQLHSSNDPHSLSYTSFHLLLSCHLSKCVTHIVCRRWRTELQSALCQSSKCERRISTSSWRESEVNFHFHCAHAFHEVLLLHFPAATTDAILSFVWNLLNLLFNRRARTMPKLFFGQACKVAGEWPKFSFPEVNGDTSIHFPRTQTLHLRLSLARCSDEKLFFFVHQTDSAVCSWHRDIATTLRRENVFTLGEHKF